MSTTQKPESLRLADKYEVHGFFGDRRFAQDHWCSQAAAELRRQHARIADLEAQLSAIGAGGVEPLRKSASQQEAHPAEGVPVQAVELDVDDLIDRLLDAQQDLNLAANVHMDQSIASASTLLDEVEIALRTLAATQPAAQGMDARDAAFEAVRKAFCKLQRYSFFLDGAGNVRRCADHCGNWVEFDAVHTLFEPQSVDAALAAQAKQGGAQQ